MPRDVPALSESQRRRIAETLKLWAEHHPHPDLPVIQLADGSELTPRDMAHSVNEPDSQRGLLLYRVFAVGLIKDDVEPPETLEEILSDYWVDIRNWQYERVR
jgi:hypothetical protein